MPGKDYYVILGVARTETAAGIRAAYRSLASKFHPDRAGEAGTRSFQEISEAYEVLSDPARRRAHNRGLDDPGQRAAPGGRGRAARPRGPAADPEPLIPDDAADRSFSLLDNPGGISPSFEALHDRLFRNFTHMGVPKSERLESLEMDLVLTPAEAARGVVVRVRVPTLHPCPVCRGTGADWVRPCVVCERLGFLEDEANVRVHIPPHVSSGAVVEVALARLGISNTLLRFHVSVTDASEPLAFG